MAFLLFVTFVSKALLEIKTVYLTHTYSIFPSETACLCDFSYRKMIENSMEDSPKLNGTCSETQWKSLKYSMELPEAVRKTDFFFWKSLIFGIIWSVKMPISRPIKCK
ncbi:MAG: hypothetical protein LUF85_08445 [Bacteroides sp.]|nr:hypothetical protein [Bacteroides sp.]